MDSVCPFCGVGCLLTYKVKDERIVAVDGRDGRLIAKLCVKGRFGFDYAHHPERLKKPLIRRKGVKRTSTHTGKILEIFSEKPWEKLFLWQAED